MTGADTPRRVLVTRPEPDAAQTAARLAATGYAPIVLPLFETLALAVDRSAIPRDAVAVAATSANAIRLAPREIVAALRHLDCFCVGAKTADAARRNGFESIIEGSGDARRLATVIIESEIQGPLVYLCGRVRRPDLEDAFGAAGIANVPVEVYDTQAISRADREVLSILDGSPIDMALVYSVTAGKALDKLSRAQNFRHLFEKTAFFCLSERVATTLQSDEPRLIRTSLEPTEDAMLSLMGVSGGRMS